MVNMVGLAIAAVVLLAAGAQSVRRLPRAPHPLSAFHLAMLCQ